ncbi:MAG TPA: uracil phosphoribosyltransferase [Bacteroidales bacterium]|nr:uracil phosphoribosyltransferase [Bacteroidales bacterium]
MVILNKQNSVFNQYLSEVRDAKVQTDSMRFRHNLERMGNIFAYEISRSLSYETKEVTTPLGIAEEKLLNENPVIISILRAGLPIHQGIINFFDKADNGFVSIFRNPEKDGNVNLKPEYVSCPELEGRTLILIDAIIASGESITMAYQTLLQYGTPRHTHFVSLVGSKEGIETIRKRYTAQNVTIWLGALDAELTVRSFVVPGIGDVGDLAFGYKPPII